MQEYIDNIVLDYTYYPGEDLYTDGSIEDELLTIAMNHKEEELNRVIAEKKSWPVMYHFSHIRQNILEWLPITKEHKVLEIGSGCGAITGALARKAGSVRCIELSKKRSYINAYRNREFDNIRIDVGNFQDIEKDLDETFDYITLIGVFEYARGYIGGNNPYVEMLQKIARHLNPGGKIVLAIENRIGLKYWAGCSEDHAGQYFEGLEGYHNFQGAKTFSKKELNEVIKAAGGLTAEYYYPYPDYKFPMTIYSDQRLPAKGELNQNICNFDRERLQVFDETKVFDTLLTSDLFPEFSNSFLLLLGQEQIQSGKEIIYVKYSNERAKQFAIRTDILSCRNQKRRVRKSACYKDGEAHIKALADYESKLTEQWAETQLCMNKSKREENSISFEFVEGETLEEQMDTLLAQNREAEAKEMFLTFLKFLKNSGERTTFRMTEDFLKIFGEQRLPNDLKALAVTDIDLVPGNLFVRDGWQVIDYEWTFLFPIPVNFVIYRAIHYYVGTSDLRKCAADWKLLSAMEISPEEELIYQEMEHHFQEYIRGEHVPIRDLYESITPGILNVYRMAWQERKKRMDERLQVFAAASGEFEEEKSTYYSMQGGRIQICLPISKETKKLRIDPCSYAGVLTIRSFRYIGTEERVFFTSNGYSLSEDRIVFSTLDPQLLIMNIPEDAAALEIDFVMDTASGEIGELFRELHALPEKKDAEIAHLRDLLTLREQQIEQMENTKVWKAYRKVKGAGRKGKD